MIMKIDLEKTFDRLEWSFIRDTLVYFGFPANLVKFITSCVSASSISILVNGKKTNVFNPTRCIKQRDPISPYLIIFCMERLSRTIDTMVQDRKWNPISVTPQGPAISHLFFADDLTLFSRDTPEDYTTITNALRNFYDCSGQKLNLQKSKIIFSQNYSIDMANQCSTSLNIPASTTFGNYLGLPMFHSRPIHNDFQYIVDRMQNKLAGWKTKMFNMAGRTILAKATLSSIPSH